MTRSKGSWLRFAVATMRSSIFVAASILLLARLVAAEEWFDAYDRGLEALRHRDGARAVELLERAARKRPEPGTNVLTYGTNRIDRYYPYLSLAEAYMLANRPDAASEALKRSEAKGKEPPSERDRLATQVAEALEKQRLASATLAPVAPPQVTSAPAPQAAIPTSALPQTAVAMPSPAAPSRIGATRLLTGTFELDSDPEGATVLAGTRLLGLTPLHAELPAGEYEISLRKEGTAETRFLVRIEAAQRTKLSRALVIATTPPPTTAAGPEIAALIVITEPPGVAVYVDDEPLGVTDPGSGRLVKSGLASGMHRLRLSRPGYADIAEDVTVTSGPTDFRRKLELITTPAPRRSPVVLALAAGAVLASAISLLLWRRRARGAQTIARSDPPRLLSDRGTGRTVSATSPTYGSPPTIGTVGGDVAPPTATTPGRRPSPASEPLATQFGDFRLLGPLGKGGMAAVFKAERRGEVCALKRPLAALLEDPEFLQRFLREAEIGHTLHHPNIIRIFERGEVAGVPYFTMEVVAGETLHAYLKKQGAMEPRAGTRVVSQVAEALDYAHLKGVVHRDLKPSNIMLLPDGMVKVMDYGIARARRFEGLTLTGAFLGTPDYMAPEAADGTEADARSDLYSLGVVFFEVLTGVRPFHGDTPFATLRKHCMEPPPPPSTLNANIPAELEAIVLRLLRKDPAERYPGAEELLIDLRKYVNHAA
jgi:hypothetical protein